MRRASRAGSATRWRCCVQRGGLRAALRDPAAAATSCRSTRRASPAMSEHLAFNTAVVFVTNTNWQSYGGETTMSHFSQMAGLTVQNFVSAATGIAMALALTRAFAPRRRTTVGNFWVDLTRATLYVLLPLVDRRGARLRRDGPAADAQTLRRCDDARRRPADHRARPGRQPGGDQAARHQWRRLLQRQRRASVREPDRAVQLHRTSSPCSASRAGARFAFGQMVGATAQGWAFLAVMVLFLVAGCAVIYWAETCGNPMLHALGVDPARQHGRQGGPLRQA